VFAEVVVMVVKISPSCFDFRETMDKKIVLSFLFFDELNL
jgi:hypothetical protein